MLPISEFQSSGPSKNDTLVVEDLREPQRLRAEFVSTGYRHSPMSQARTRRILDAPQCGEFYLAAAALLLACLLASLPQHHPSRTCGPLAIITQHGAWPAKNARAQQDRELLHTTNGSRSCGISFFSSLIPSLLGFRTTTPQSSRPCP